MESSDLLSDFLHRIFGFSFRGSISVTSKRHYLGPSGLIYPEEFSRLNWNFSLRL